MNLKIPEISYSASGFDRIGRQKTFAMKMISPEYRKGSTENEVIQSAEYIKLVGEKEGCVENIVERKDQIETIA